MRRRLKLLGKKIQTLTTKSFEPDYRQTARSRLRFDCCCGSVVAPTMMAVVVVLVAATAAAAATVVLWSVGCNGGGRRGCGARALVCSPPPTTPNDDDVGELTARWRRLLYCCSSCPQPWLNRSGTDRCDTASVHTNRKDATRVTARVHDLFFFFCYPIGYFSDLASFGYTVQTRYTVVYRTRPCILCTVCTFSLVFLVSRFTRRVPVRVYKRDV